MPVTVVARTTKRERCSFATHKVQSSNAPEALSEFPSWIELVSEMSLTYADHMRSEANLRLSYLPADWNTMIAMGWDLST